MRRTKLLVCECGRNGQMHISENESSHSALWERYRPEGFEGKVVIITGTNYHVDVLAEMNLTCPDCGESGRVSYAE